MFAVTDFKVADLDVELGIGCGLTPGSDRLVAKAILGYAFPVPGTPNESADGQLKTPLTAKSPVRGNAASPFPWNAQ